MRRLIASIRNAAVRGFLTFALVPGTLLLPIPCQGATKLLVTVVEESTMGPVKDLKATDLEVVDGKRVRAVESVERASGLLDIALLVDASLVGEMVQPAAANIIEQLGEKDQMSIVAFDSAATLVQDFTSSQDLLLQSLSKIKYGNAPRILDAVYATVDGAFENTGFRRVVILITAGMEAGSRTSAQRLYQVARKNEVTVYALFVGGWRGMFREIAEQTGGAALNLQDLQKRSKSGPGELVFGLIQNQYIVSISGDSNLSDKAKIRMKRPGKYRVGYLELD
jgi:VWFA-related protein